MACSRFLLKKLLAASNAAATTTRSTVLAAAAAAATDNRRGFATAIPDIYVEPLLGPMLRGVPHTLFYTTKLSHGEENEQYINRLSLMRNDADLKFSLHLPGNQRMSFNKAGIGIRLDLELDMCHHDDDGSFDDQIVETKIVNKMEAFFIKGYVQKSNIRNYYYARINLPDVADKLSDSVKTEVKDGFMNVSLPWQIESLDSES